jgi:hypothetical protein
MNTIFPDVEKLLIARIKSLLEASSNPVADNVWVANKKPPADVTPYPGKICTIRSDGGPDTERGLIRAERVGINVYTETVADASELSRLIEALLRSNAWGDVKLIETDMSPMAVPNEGPQEQRYMTLTVYVKASNL